MKKIAALTMIRRDELFLKLWVEYYSRELGAENLYVLLDGEDLEIPRYEGVHFEVFPHISLNVAEGDKLRIERINAKAQQLFKTYDIVIGGDVDEFLAVDPDTGLSLAAYLDSRRFRTCLSGLGLDVGQHLKTETEYTPQLPVLSQRHYALLSTRYTKPAVLASGSHARWGSGFHRVKHHNFHIDKNLFLFHLGCFDYNYAKQKFSLSERLDEGWERHFNKRIRTITYITSLKPVCGERILRTARRIQTFFRPVYCWNKPSMLHLRRVVEIPERFKTVL